MRPGTRGYGTPRKTLWSTRAAIQLNEIPLIGGIAELAATVSADASVTSALSLLISTAVEVIGTSSVTSTLTDTVSMAASISSAATIIASQSLLSLVSSQINSTSSVTANLAFGLPLVASLTASASVTANLTSVSVAQLASTISGVGTMEGALLLIEPSDPLPRRIIVQTRSPNTLRLKQRVATALIVERGL